MLRLKKLILVLLLTMLWLILPIGSTPMPNPPVMTQVTTQPDSVLVPVQMLRDATRRIDQQDLRILLLENRIVERDSLLSSRDREYDERVAYWQDYAEKVKASTWDLIWPALLVALGAVLGSI